MSIRMISAQSADPKAPPDCLLLCKSQGRQSKEQAIDSQAEQQLLDDLEGLAKSVENGRAIDEVKIQRRIGKILGGHSRAAHAAPMETRLAPPRSRGR